MQLHGGDPYSRQEQHSRAVRHGKQQHPLLHPHRPLPALRLRKPAHATLQRKDVEFLFRALEPEHVVEIFLSLLLERKILLVSAHRALLYHCSTALISFLYPFRWVHNLIPVLPMHLVSFLDAPFPFLIGLETEVLGDLDVPEGVNTVMLDEGTFEMQEHLPKIPTRELKYLTSRLRKVCSIFKKPDPVLKTVDEAFNTVFIVEAEEEEKFNELEVRDAFLEFMQGIMKNYPKFIVSRRTCSRHPVRARQGPPRLPELKGLLQLQGLSL